MTEMPDKEENIIPVETDNPKKALKKKIAKLEEENAKLQADVEHWKNEYYRAYADTKNLRNNLEKEHQSAIKYRAEGFIDELLPVLDSFYMVLANEPTDPTLKNYLVGFQYIYKNLSSVLEKEGVSEILPKVGDKFDASTMNAMEAIESDGQENQILKVHSKGYKLHDRLIRPANVTVSVHHKKENKEDSLPESDA